jgi:hypothetical protein
MTIHLGKRWQKKLAELPETGMGSQHVDITLKNGHVIHDLTVFNGEDCQAAEAFDPGEIADIRLHRPAASGRISKAA